jgi:hypothetical protein
MALTGIWLNELNSVMVLIEDAHYGLTGKYRSIVGRDPRVRDLAGRTNYFDSNKQMVGFAICFEIANPAPSSGHTSICAWSGSYKKHSGGREEIDTHWLLTVNELDPKDEWGSHLIGEDTFVKVLDEPREDVLTDDQMLKELHERSKG